MAEKDTNALAMSDEDFLNAPMPGIDDMVEAEKPAVAAAADETDDEVADPVADPAPTADADESEESDDAETGTVDAAKDDDDEDAEADDKKVVAPVKDEAKKVEAPAKTDDKVDDKAASLDFEAEYNRLLAPFKANGREIQVKSVDDAIALMQMGANYNKKMAGLKPNLKLLKLLENNGLLSEEKLSYLIDLDKKDPAAINKLVKDSGLDPHEFDAEKAGTYRPTIQKVDDREVELDSVLDDIAQTPSYNRTLAIVSKEWDGPSKQIIADTPQLLKVINDHVDRGIYDLISAEVESERAVGRLAGLSDIEAYRQIGDSMNARGGFNHLGSSQGKPAAGEVVTPKPKKVDDDKLKDKRRAAAPTKPAAPTSIAKDFNPLALSDAEFAKLADPRYA